MTTRAEELEVRNIMQGLEDFASFMSYKSNYEGMRILSVETHASFPEKSAEIIPFVATHPDDESLPLLRAITR